MEKLLKHILDANEDIIKKFNISSIQGEGTPQEVSDFREGFVQDLIRKYFSLPHKVTKGIIHDSFNKKSNSIDCVIVNPKHPNIISTVDKLAYLLADGVDSCIEVKPNIQDNNELTRGLDQVQSVKKLRRVNSAYLQLDKSVVDDDIINLSKQIPTFIYSLKAKANPIETAAEIAFYYKEKKIPLDEQFDYIVIHNVGIISNYKHDRFNLISPPNAQRTGWFFEQWDENTLAAFLLYLNIVPPAETVLTMPILFNYLSKIKPTKLTRLELTDMFFEKSWPN